MKSLTVLFKPVSSTCNLNCTYCYYGGGDTIGKNRIMTEETATSAIKNLSSLASHYQINFIWHGGEPLLAGQSFFRHVIEQQKKTNLSIRNSIQTNATLINSQWCEIFESSGFKSVGVSLDGPEHIHNKNRYDHGGTGSFKYAIRGINIIRESNLNVGVLATITKASLGNHEEIFEFFVENEIQAFDFLPCHYTGDLAMQSIAISPSEWSEFMQEMFDLWFDYDNPDIKIRFLMNIVEGLLGGKPSLCSLSNNCRSFLTIEHDGTVYPCDDFSNNDEYKLGNIKRNILDEMLELGDLTLSKDNMINNLDCSSCRFFDLCGGGCLRHYDISSDVCKARYALFSHIENRVTVTQKAIESQN